MTAEQVISAYLAAWGRGDPETAFAFYADDVVMRLPGRAPEAGVHRGREAVVACIRSLLSRIDDLAVEVELIEAAYGAERAFLLLREWAGRGGSVLDIRRVNAYRTREGQIVEIEVFEGDQYGVDAFFGGARAPIGESP